ncbi:uncharacterized protein ACLA_057660 [Aspergillus clavatus NRRL 1]|uniref:RNA polymerase Rpb1 C-terminal repeat domain protein n=1 Tax=Aspergillus clavatus (strain ATCC 1007 / CBS 513.65 / DSM 816 / NCTC 3887 / NRRL 1 / QM 1276 / 107) TaxID=344612 RepID=A1C3X0_ASPCL|nr:RNA polymerase Rpb1 C-terminal repeat domain protein [Aspergillus clavatus NRRL 1]EAW15110.1 RNA polymerase Rpb1 C-terminal repeat domain protein [Aspergillus clavatus NRRL 1]
MAGSGKKSKGKTGGKQKNKKGKTQETSENPVEPSTLEQQDQPQQPEPEPEPEVEVESQPTQAPEAEPNPPLDPVPEQGQDPEPVPELEHPQPIAEQAPAALENWDLPQALTNIDEDGSLQVASPDAPPSQPQTLSDVQHIFEAAHESILEELAAPEPVAEPAEANLEKNDTLVEQSDAVEPAEPTLVTAPQTPSFSTAGDFFPQQSPSLTETPHVETAPRSNTASPTLDISAEAEAEARAQAEAEAEALVEAAKAEAAEAEATEVAQAEADPSPLQEEPIESAEQTNPPEAAPASPAPQPALSSRAVSPAPFAAEPASPVVLPALSPRAASPAPVTADLASPGTQPDFSSWAASADFSEQDAFSSVLQTAAPASKSPSPAPQAASPVYQPASPAFNSTSPDFNPSSPVFQDIPPQHRAGSPYSASPVQRMASPMANPVSPLQKYASPSAKPASPAVKNSSPLTRAYMSPAMSPNAMPLGPPPPAHSVPPSIAPGYAPAYHSPVLSSAGYLPPYAPHYHQPSPNMLPTHRGSIDPHYASTFQALRDMGLPNGHGVNDKGTISPPHEHDEPIELLQRIQDAIPDINRLLSGYRNTKTKLVAREAEFKQMESQHEQALMHKDFYIEALQNQMRKAANESVEETTKLKNTINELRMELGNLEEKRKDLEENLAESEKSNQELLEVKSDLEGQVATLNTNMQEAQEAHEKELERREVEKTEALANQKQELTELFEEIKAEDERAAAEALEAREKELLDQQDAMKTEYENEKQQMQESRNALQSEFDAKVVELDAKVTELEATHNELNSTKTALEDKQKELEETLEQSAQEIEQLKNSHEEKVTEMENQFNQKEQIWGEERTELETRISEKCAELDDSLRENKKLEEDNVLKEQQLQHAVGGMRTTIDNLGQDCDRLRKTLHSLGEATDLKSTKGDTFFLDCFDQLSRLIVSLSKEHFTYLPIDPPKDILSKIPPELPSFLDNTPASRELRSAYVQHVVSKTLTYRIFQPFLFTLGRRYDKADTFFQMLSMDIRRKSVRREAFWRQQTLKAAYTTSDAKQSINVVAGVIVDEIINQIKHFADPRHLDSLLVSVRKIVKLAAETWRLARVERELILATLPAPDAEEVSNDGWGEYGTAKEGGSSPRAGPSRHVILRTFPQITREAAHEDFAEDAEKASPCTYSRGMVLYSDSPIVMARLQELAKKSTETLSGGEESPQTGSRGSLRSRKDKSSFEGNGSPDKAVDADDFVHV